MSSEDLDRRGATLFGARLRPVVRRDDGPGPRGRDAGLRRAVRRDQGLRRRHHDRRVRRPRRGDRDRAGASLRALGQSSRSARYGNDAPDDRGAGRGRCGVPGRVGPGGRDADRADRGLGPGGGVRAGGVRGRAGDVAARRRPEAVRAPGSPPRRATARPTGCGATRRGARSCASSPCWPGNRTDRPWRRSRTSGCG